MSEPSQPNQVLDAELKAWAEGEGDDQRELIVEARVPKRTVSLGNSPSGRILPREVDTAKNADRNSLLEELQHDLDELLGTTTNLLRSAGVSPSAPTGSSCDTSPVILWCGPSEAIAD